MRFVSDELVATVETGAANPARLTISERQLCGRCLIAERRLRASTADLAAVVDGEVSWVAAPAPLRANKECPGSLGQVRCCAFVSEPCR